MVMSNTSARRYIKFPGISIPKLVSAWGFDILTNTSSDSGINCVGKWVGEVTVWPIYPLNVLGWWISSGMKSNVV